MGSGPSKVHRNYLKLLYVQLFSFLLFMLCPIDILLFFLSFFFDFFYIASLLHVLYSNRKSSDRNKKAHTNTHTHTHTHGQSCGADLIRQWPCVNSSETVLHHCQHQSPHTHTHTHTVCNRLLSYSLTHPVEFVSLRKSEVVCVCVCMCVSACVCVCVCMCLPQCFCW